MAEYVNINDSIDYCLLHHIRSGPKVLQNCKDTYCVLKNQSMKPYRPEVLVSNNTVANDLANNRQISTDHHKQLFEPHFSLSSFPRALNESTMLDLIINTDNKLKNLYALAHEQFNYYLL